MPQGCDAFTCLIKPTGHVRLLNDHKHLAASAPGLSQIRLGPLSKQPLHGKMLRSWSSTDCQARICQDTVLLMPLCRTNASIGFAHMIGVAYSVGIAGVQGRP